METAEILRDCGARWLVADSAFAELVRATLEAGTAVEGVAWIGADAPALAIGSARFEEELARGSRGFAPSARGGDDVAHLYYTSGTTGRAKGVMLTHRNVFVHALGTIGELALSDRDAWAHVAPMFHLADAWATFAITHAGGRHVMLPRFEAEPALDLIERERVTLTNLIPTMLNLMVRHPSARGRDFGALRMILSGGAPIAPDVVRAIVDTFGCEYVQTYGMTETSPYLTLSLLKEHLRALPFDERLAYACKTGRAFATVELRVVGADGCDVPADERTVGEIRVRGETVTPGYWNRPEETRAAFEDGWLKTGDLAVIDREGFVTIVDRAKDMILSGGENVYSTEVEHALYAHPSVLEAAVFGVPDDTWGERVHAAVVLRASATASTEELIAFCRARLSAFKCPRSIDFLAELPRTGSGKIQKRALREPFWAGRVKRV
jgi:acyl-CoA synthetase (AMP-forming)/AMP-acid ligase II